MEYELKLKIILQEPPEDVDFGLQKGSGAKYETVQKQKSSKEHLTFACAVAVKLNKQGEYDFYGPFAQGPSGEKFVYIDIGTYAGERDSAWGRRLKIPLYTIPQNLLRKMSSMKSPALSTSVPGKGKDGTPNCATVRGFVGWS